jgi:anti-repressor protein
MPDLLSINDRQVGQHQIPTVNARELHTFLEVGKDFSNWIKDRIDQYGFFENLDFVVIANSGENPRGGRPTKDYYLSLDTAKEISMVERNEKGKQARMYFIACERRAKAAPAITVPTTLSAALRLAADQAEQIEQQTAQLEAQKPAVEFVGRYVQAAGSMGFREVCKTLGANEREFAAWLLNTAIAYRLGGRLTAFQNHIDAGRFEVKAGSTKPEQGKEARAFTQTRFTPKGFEWIAGKWAAYQLQNTEVAA